MDFTRVLVLGATGRLGGILRRCWGAEAAQWQSRRGAGPDWAEPGWAIFDPLQDSGALARAARGATAILCLAGVTPARAGAGGEGAIGDMSDNTALAEAAIRAGAVSGARVFLTSSAAVYGNQAGFLDEASPLLGQSAYGRAKADMESRGAALGAELGVPVCALRIGNIAGADAILGGWKPGFRLDRFADGHSPRRSYIGPVTLARVLGALVVADELPAVLNIAAPGGVEMGALLDAAGLAWTAQPAPEAAIPEVVLSVRALSAFVTLSARDGLAQTLVDEWRDMSRQEGRPMNWPMNWTGR